MPLVANNTNPINDFTQQGITPSFSIDGLVAEGIYPLTGVIDQLKNTNVLTPYNAPEIGIVNSTMGLGIPNPFIPNNNGWYSPIDYGGSSSETWVQFNLSSSTWLNNIVFSIYNVPCNWSLWYVDGESGITLQATDTNGNAIGGVISGSSQILSTYSSQATGTPLNATWVNFNYSLFPIETSALQLRIDRNVSLSLIPLDIQPSFSITQYPVGISNFAINLATNNWEDAFPVDSQESRQSVWGFTEEIAIDQHPGGDVLTTSGFWKSEPQPVKDAVVCFYLDVRSTEETSQVLDTLYIEPLYSGCRMNVYYSTDTPNPAVFHLSRNQSAFDVTGTPTMEPSSSSIQGTLLGNGSYLSLPNSKISLSLQNPFSIGLNFSLPYSFESFTSEQMTLWSIEGVNTDSLDLSIISNTLELRYYTSSTNYTSILTWVIPSTVAEPLSLIVGYDGTSFYLYANGILEDSYSSNILTGAVAQTLFIGTNPSTSLQPGSGAISNFFIRQDSPEASLIATYQNNPSRFIDAKGVFDITRGDYKGLLNARLTQDLNCLSGPGSDYYSSLVWTPVQQDFSLQKGFYHIPPCIASYLKLEITNLSASPYPMAEDSIPQIAQVFPDWITSYFQDLQSQFESNTTQIQSFSQTGSAPITFYNAIPTATLYGEANSFLGTGSPWPSQNALTQNQMGSSSWIMPNQAAYVIDPTSSINTLDLSNSSGNLLNSENTLTTWITPRFYTVGQHQYKYVNIEQTWKEAYFAGISNIGIFRSLPFVYNDTPEYNELCLYNDPGSIVSQEETTMLPVGVLNAGGYVAQNTNDVLITHNLSSFSECDTVQLAGMTSDWTSALTDEEILLQNTNNVILENSISSTFQTSTGLGISPSIAYRDGSYWPLTDPIGSTSAVDLLSNNSLDVESIDSATGVVTFQSTGIWPVEEQKSVAISGSGYLSTPIAYNPSYNFSILGSIQTTTAGGCIFSMSSASTGDTDVAYIALYMDTTGLLHFYGGNSLLTVPSLAAVNDGKTHRIAATLQYLPSIGTTINLYVDGILNGSISNVANGVPPATFYIKLGVGNVSTLLDPPTNNWYTGSLSEFIFLDALVNSQQITKDAVGIIPFSNYGLCTSPSSSNAENLLSESDSNFDLGTSGNWIPITNCTGSGSLPVSTAYAEGGSGYSGELTAIASGNIVAGIGTSTSSPYAVPNSIENFLTTYGQIPYGAGDFGGALSPLSTTQTWTWIVDILASSVARTCYLTVNYWDVQGTLLSSSNGPSITETVGAWTQMFVTSTAPANTYSIGIEVTVENAALGENHYIAENGLFSGTNTIWSTPINYQGMRISAVARVFLPASSQGTYQIRLKSNGQIVSSQSYQGILNTWMDLETIYLSPFTGSSPGSLQAEVVQINPGVNESFIVGMLSYFYHPVRWEISTDTGNTYTPIVVPINNPNGYMTISPSNELKLRLTALTPNTYINAFMIQPIYEQSPITPITPINSYPSPLVNENFATKAPILKSMFQLSEKFYPARFLGLFS